MGLKAIVGGTIISAALLAQIACGVEPTPTAEPTATPAPTATPKPTATKAPTATPKPTATKSPPVYSSEDLRKCILAIPGLKKETYAQYRKEMRALGVTPKRDHFDRIMESPELFKRAYWDTVDHSQRWLNAGHCEFWRNLTR